MNRRSFIKKTGLTLSALVLAETIVAAGPNRSVDNDPEYLFLRRSSYGVKDSDYKRVKDIGIKAYLQKQLEPTQIADPEVERRLEPYPLLTLNRRELYSLNNSDSRAASALINAFLIRATYSKRQLYEKMVEFWSDHFNMPLESGAEDYVIFQREIIRKHALGNFRKMLFATAKSPAMLYYLDNAENIAEHPNENYARELMELHTLGVDGGYSEQDVREVARAFTGWTTSSATEDGFIFESYNHDTEEKHVLGHHLPAHRGIEDGLQVLNMLALHPSTARYISYKLCRRFVSDDPPESLVERLAKIYLQEKAEIKPLLLELFTSPEFYLSAGKKYRRPLEYYVAALRATGSEIYNEWRKYETLTALDQLPYGWGPPDGYPDVAHKWISAGGLLNRWKLANSLTHESSSTDSYGLYGNLAANHPGLSDYKTVAELVEAVSKKVFGKVLSSDGLEPFIDYASDGAGADEPINKFLIARKLDGIYALMLSSKEFQWT